MSLTHLPASARAASPWRNGGGITREVALEPSADGVGFRWRISIADVASDGPFSPFEGCGRVIALLRGNGMELTVDGVAREVTRRGDPFRFSGDAVTSCRLLDGPVVDVNLIHANDQPATLVVHDPPLVALGATARAVVLALDQPARVRTERDAVTLMPLDAVDIQDEADPIIEGGAVMVVRIGSSLTG